MSGLRASRAALRSGGVEQFREVVERGVSANLCDALVAMSGSGRRELEVGIGWSKLQPVPTEAVSHVELVGPEIKVLREASANAPVG